VTEAHECGQLAYGRYAAAPGRGLNRRPLDRNSDALTSRDGAYPVRLKPSSHRRAEHDNRKKQFHGKVCDARLVRRQIYGYLPSRRASPPLDRGTKLYCSLTEARVCEQLAQRRYLKVERPGVEPATFFVASQHPSWRRGVVVSGVRRMDEVNARRARLVPGWVTVFGRVYRLGMQQAN